MGGDRDIEDAEDKAIINAMAEGVKRGDAGAHLFTFHPQGGKSSLDFFNEAAWIDFHKSQTGHATDTKNYKYNEKHRTMTPTRLHVDGEPRYEDHSNKFNPESRAGWMILM